MAEGRRRGKGQRKVKQCCGCISNTSKKGRKVYRVTENVSHWATDSRWVMSMSGLNQFPYNSIKRVKYFYSLVIRLYNVT